MPVELTEKEFKFGSYGDLELGIEYKHYDENYKYLTREFKGKQVIHLSEIISSEYQPAGFFKSAKLIIDLKDRGFFKYTDMGAKYTNELIKLNSLINEFLSDKDQKLKDIEEKERLIIEREEEEKRIKKERLDTQLTLYSNTFKENEYKPICVSKLLKTELDNYSKDVKIFYNDKDKCLLIEKDYNVEFNKFAEMYEDAYSTRFVKVDLSSIDCIYRDRADYYDSGLAEVLNKAALNSALLNVKSSLKDFSGKNDPKIDVAGFVVGGMLGGTAGAILGGMPTPTQTDSINTNSTKPAYLNTQAIIKDLPQLVIRYKNNGEHKYLVFDDNHFAIDREFLNQILIDKFVDSQTGEAFYLMQNQTKDRKEKADVYEEVKKLKELYDLDILTKDEFERKKKELLNL